MPSAVAHRKDNKEMQSRTSPAIANFVSDSSVSSIDGVELSAGLYNKLFPDYSVSKEDDEGSPELFRYVLVRFLGAPDYFKNFKIYRVTSVDGQDHDGLSVTFYNHTNLAKFNEQITLSKCIVQSIASKNIPKLERVFVSVPDSVYQILELKPSRDVRELFLKRFLLHTGGVVCTGDIVRDINGQIELCEPVLQGEIDSAVTNIVLIKTAYVDEQDLSSADYLESEVNDGEDTDGDDVEDGADGQNEIDFSSFLIRSASTDTPHKEFPLLAKPLPEKLAVEGPSSSLLAKEDLDLFVFINSADLAKLGFPVFNGDSVKLTTSSGTSVIVKVLTVIEPNRTFRQGSIYLSPLLLLNLAISSEENSEVVLSPVKDLQLLLSSLLPTAKSLTISRVASPITMDKTYQQSFFAELKSTFHNQFKCVRKGDLIPVCIDSVLAKTMFDAGDNEAGAGSLFVIPTGDPDSVAWFKIVTVGSDAAPESSPLSDQFVIDPLKTRMISSGIESIRLPENNYSQWMKYLQLPSPFPFTKVSKNDPSVFQYASELRKIVTTCLNFSNSKLKTSILLNSMSRGLGKTSVVRDLSLSLGLNLIELDCFDIINPGAELKTIGFLKGKIDKLIENTDTSNGNFYVVYLKHIENLCVKTNENEQGSSVTTSLSMKVVQVLQDYLNTYSNLILICSCNDVDKLNEGLRLMIKFQIDFGVPSEKERLEIFKYLIDQEVTGRVEDVNTDEHGEDLLGGESVGNDIEDDFSMSSLSFSKRGDVTYKALALQSAGLTPRDLISILKNSKRLAIIRLKELAESLNLSVRLCVEIGNGGLIQLIPDDFNKAINEARNQFSDSIGAPRIPNVKWEDIGGLDLVKDEILDTIDMPLKHPELFNNGLKKRSGILFYGPPGTGKTLLAKAIATNFSLNFFSVKGPELLNMYIGESEANVRRVFQRARDAKPCVIFFDELDSVAPKRGNQGDSGGVMDRIVSQLLAELDGMSGGGAEGGGDGVFVVGATNRPDLLDEALLRPGRFDKMLYLGISDTNEKQAKILEALTRKFQLADDVDLNKIAENCSFTFTGADFYALCSDSMLNAMTRTANIVDQKIKKFNAELIEQGKPEISSRWWFDNEASEEDTNVEVTMEDFVKAQLELNPSVSAEELQHYLTVRQNFEGGKEKAKHLTQLQEGSGNGHIERGKMHEFLDKVQELVGEQVDGISDVNGNPIGLANGTPSDHSNVPNGNPIELGNGTSEDHPNIPNGTSGDHPNIPNGN